VLAGVLVGAGLPMIFAALTMLSVDRGARAIITEVRLQFATAPRLMKGDLTEIFHGHSYPDSTRCVVIATEAAIQEMILPGVLAVFVPVAVGFLLGPKGTVGMLAGGLGGCFMLATMMATAGGAWDNAKKWATRCGEEGEPVAWAEDGATMPTSRLPLVRDAAGEAVPHPTFANFGLKRPDNFPEMLAKHGVEAFLRDPKAVALYSTPEKLAELQAAMADLYKKRHSATVVGDTLGDPFKDTSGPSLNVLIKTMTMMALVLAPAYKSFAEYDGFGLKGTVISAVTAVVIGSLSYFLVAYFNRINKEKNDVSVAAKKVADAKIARGVDGDEEADAGGLGDAQDKPLLRRG